MNRTALFVVVVVVVVVVDLRWWQPGIFSMSYHTCRRGGKRMEVAVSVDAILMRGEAHTQPGA